MIKQMLLLLIASSGVLLAQDVPGSKDHALVTRYPGATIGYYEEQKFASYKVATGPETSYKKIDKWLNAQGKLTRIYYIVKGTTTVTEVFGNYISAFTNAGFTVLAKGVDDKTNVSKEVGGKTHLVTFYASNPFPASKGINLLNGSSTSGGTCYIATQIKKNRASVYVVVGGCQYKADEKVFMVDIIEEAAMEDDLIIVNDDEMLRSIQANGKVALYGIYFDFDKTDMKPESKPTLDEIAKLLKVNATLNLYVVGHTDMKGTLDYNLNLSKKRAESIVNELVKSYSIASSRLSAQGVGPLVPVANNQTEEGAALNRRVELVEK